MELGTAFAVVAFADQVLKYGRKFVKRCQSYLHAEDEATELLIAIECNWTKIETQIEILQKIAGSLDKRLQDIQAQILSQLEGKLKTATLMINQLEREKREEILNEKSRHDERDIATRMRSLGGMSTSKKIKYVSKKESLYKIVEEIEKWQARYDPTWILIMQMSIGDIDKRLEEQEKKSEKNQIPAIVTAARRIREARASQEGTTENCKTGTVGAI